MEYDWAFGLGRLFELPPQTTPVSLKPIIPGALYAWVVKDFPTPPIAAGLSVDRAKLRFSKEGFGSLGFGVQNLGSVYGRWPLYALDHCAAAAVPSLPLSMLFQGTKARELREEMRLEGSATHLGALHSRFVGASASHAGYLGFMVWSVKSKCRLLKLRLLHGYWVCICRCMRISSSLAT